MHQLTFLLTFMGGALNVELGGMPITRRRTRLPKCGGTRTVELSDIARARLAIYQTQGLFIASWHWLWQESPVSSKISLAIR